MTFGPAPRHAPLPARPRLSAARCIPRFVAQTAARFVARFVVRYAAESEAQDAARLPALFPALGLALALPFVPGLAPPAAALTLEQPIDCQVGRNCFVQNHMDLAPGPEWADPACGPLSYDKHKGTDFRILFGQMRLGVAVKAAAPGLVRGVRDGVADVSVRQAGAESVRGRECGNGVVLRHADGEETQYCHLRQGSVRVKPGQTVQTGQVLGLAGLSGKTEFPHLHFEVRLGGTAVCPFTGKPLEGGCDGPGPGPLWSAQALAALPYQASGALDAGFADEPPDLNRVFTGGAPSRALTTRSPNLVFWAGFWGTREGDVATLRVTTPAGETWAGQPQTVSGNKAQSLFMLGKKHTRPWPPGTYRGEAELRRNGAVVATLSRAALVE